MQQQQQLVLLLLLLLLMMMMMMMLKEYCGGMRSAYRVRMVLYYVELRCIAWCGDVLLMKVCGGCCDMKEVVLATGQRPSPTGSPWAWCLPQRRWRATCRSPCQIRPWEEREERDSGRDIVKGEGR